MTEHTTVDVTERRLTPGLVELRSSTTDSGKIGGYAAVFDKLSRNLGGYVERIDQRAFNGSRAANFQDVIARYNHDKNLVLGTMAGGTLELRIDPQQGLWYEVTPPKSRADVLELVQRGDVRYSSFAFRAMSNGDEWTTTDQGYPMRSLVDVQLIDVAPVVDPAYFDSSVGLRSFAAKFDADIEEVRSLAESDELRKFFARTDTGAGAVVKPKIFGPTAALELLKRREDPFAGQ